MINPHREIVHEIFNEDPFDSCQRIEEPAINILILELFSQDCWGLIRRHPLVSKSSSHWRTFVKLWCRTLCLCRQKYRLTPKIAQELRARKRFSFGFAEKELWIESWKLLNPIPQAARAADTQRSSWNQEFELANIMPKEMKNHARTIAELRYSRISSRRFLPAKWSLTRARRTWKKFPRLLSRILWARVVFSIVVAGMTPLIWTLTKHLNVNRSVWTQYHGLPLRHLARGVCDLKTECPRSGGDVGWQINTEREWKTNCETAEFENEVLLLLGLTQPRSPTWGVGPTRQENEGVLDRISDRHDDRALSPLQEAFPTRDQAFHESSWRRIQVVPLCRLP